jgi:CheY-like chemotaxis protein
MGGKLWVESEPGKGSTFHLAITLPTPDNGSPRLESLNTTLTLAGKTVLVLEEDVESGKVLERMLRGWEAEPVLVRSIHEGADTIRSFSKADRPIHLLLVNPRMPGSDSLEAFQYLHRGRASRIPMVLMVRPQDRDQELSAIERPGFVIPVMTPVWKVDLQKALISALSNSQNSLSNLSNFSVQGIRTVKPEPNFAPRRGQKSLRILLAEDNLINQQVATRLLQKQNHDVRIAQNGIEALNAMSEELFDLVLMDVQMPEMCGLEATRLIREQEKGSGRRQLIIAMTAHALAGDRERCLEAGMDEYLSKPIRLNELYAVLDEVSCSGPISA